MDNKQQCCQTVTKIPTGQHGWFRRHEHRCPHAGKYEHEGQWYCKQHHPPTVKAKDEERYKARESKWEAERKQRRLERAAPDLLAACKYGLRVMESIAKDTLEYEAIRMMHDAIAKAEGSDE